MHLPYGHPDLWKFLKAINKKYKPDRVICMGDEVDLHAVSYHEHDPDLDSAGKELDRAIHFLQPIFEMFPVVDVLESNHGSLVHRKAMTAGLPKRALKTYREMLGAPLGWRWHFDLRIEMSNGVDLYLHHGKSGKPAELSKREGCCSAEGHFHEKFGATYWRNSSGLYWGLHCGYLGDHDSLAMAYAKSNIGKGIVGTFVILDGHPRALPMILNRFGRWTGELL